MTIIGEEMLERVALAMCCASPCEGCSGNGEGGCFELALWQREARAAIDAMGSPEAVTVMREALAVRDATAAKCPIQSGFQDICPRCKATSSQMCGLIAGEDHNFVETVRAALSKVTR